MTVTRAKVEEILIRRCGGLLSEAGLAITYAGANANLNDPIGWAIRQCGGSVSDPVSVTNSDVATVGETDADKLFDLAELRTLESISGNLAVVDLDIGPRSEKLGQLAEMVEKRLARKQQAVRERYGFGMVKVTGRLVRADG